MLATDSALLNKSLLDQLDAQADAEPLSSSDDSSAESPRLKMASAPFYPNRTSFTAFPNTNRAPTRNFFPDPFALQHYPYPPATAQPVMHSQTPYGPHVPASLPMAPPPPILPPIHEDISTIFVVGFPEDMQEREFQNMFTFSPGFEAATLKIPNKEYTAYGLPPMGPQQHQQQRALGGAGQYNSYAGSNDPYNLVTVNQGGVVVDAGREGITSWPAPPDDQHNNNGPQPPGPYPPRKQIIGFAKFRTREEALGARDVLQGRRIDIEKGAVLKAEMAKKNLHTKRGVGPVAGPGMNGSNAGPPPPMQMMMNPDMYDALSPREREAGALAAMGLPNNNANGVRLQPQQPQWRLEDEAEELMAAMHERTPIGMRGPRERVAEDEAERLRRRERDRRAGAFEGFAAHREREREAEQAGVAAGPWGVPGHRPSSPESATGHDFAPRAFSSPPPEFVPGRYGANGALQYMQHQHHEAADTGYAFQQQQQQQHYHPFLAHRQERSDSSSASEGSGGSDEREFARLSLGNGVNGFHVPVGSGVNGTSSNGSASGSSKGSPQLGSPESVGASSSAGHTPGATNNLTQLNTSNGPNNAARAVDQNPPINTLYVGNLPSGGAGMDYLEAALRELFAGCVGYRQMSFRPKANGPMCFVEFEDVGFATKTLNELYGNTLGGLIKGGGIRLSYSKNPFGVKTPTSASASASMGALQLQQSMASSQAGMVQQQHQHQHQQPHSMAAAEAAFHGHPLPHHNGHSHSRLTSPPPVPISLQQQQQQQQQQPVAQELPQPSPFAAPPRFFSAAEGAGGGAAWGRRWETVGANGTGPRALGITMSMSPPPNSTGFAPFTPTPPALSSEGEQQ
ncbi:hypothetical protein C8F01DRAFT_622435 [Mycena amicta]|nr:hypothetical protein C8F01DRAFT_622435 [Mycena amicta]